MYRLSCGSAVDFWKGYGKVLIEAKNADFSDSWNVELSEDAKNF